MEVENNLKEVNDGMVVLNTDIDNLIKENEELKKLIASSKKQEDYWSNEYFEEKRKHKADVEHLKYLIDRYFELLAKSI